MGCGLGSLSETLCPTVLEHCEKPLVLDADAPELLRPPPGKPCGS